jgi:hypothetical protein
MYVYRFSSEPLACASFQVPFIDDDSVIEDAGGDTTGSSEPNLAAEEADSEGMTKIDQELSTGEKLRDVPQPGNGEQIYEIDPMLRDFKYHLGYRYALFLSIFTFLFMKLPFQRKFSIN